MNVGDSVSAWASASAGMDASAAKACLMRRIMAPAANSTRGDWVLEDESLIKRCSSSLSRVARLHDELKLIPVDEILYFVADQKYVSVVHPDGRDLIEDSLKSLESEFEDSFVRIHRGAVVAISAIDSLKKDEDGRTRVILRGCEPEDNLIVSRRHVADVKRRLKKG